MKYGITVHRNENELRTCLELKIQYTVNRVHSESRCALRLLYVDLVVRIEVAIGLCLVSQKLQ
jgi:hypothetical protein